MVETKELAIPSTSTRKSSLFRLVVQFGAFSGVGAIGTVAHYVVLLTLVEFFTLDAVLSTSAGAIIGAAVNYILNYKFTFRSRNAHVLTFPKYLFVTTTSFLININVMNILINKLNLEYFTSQIVATGVVLIWNFFGNKIWTFRCN